MAAVTTKRSKASAVKQASIQDTNAFLQSLPEKPKEDLSLRESVEQMRDSVRAALAKGYTYQELAAMLTEKGIRISAFTLKNYVPSGRRRSTKEHPAKAIPKRGRKSKAETEASLASSAEKATNHAKAETVVTTVSTSKETAKAPAKTPRGRGKATTAARTKSSSEATVKQPTAKRGHTPATKTDGKPATTRGRKKTGA